MDLTVFFQILAFLSIFALILAGVALKFDVAIAAIGGGTATAIGFMALYVCTLSPDLQPSIAGVWTFIVLSIIVTALCVCACVLGDMNEVLACVENEPRQAFIETGIQPAVVPFAGFTAKLRGVHIHLPRRAHVHV